MTPPRPSLRPSRKKRALLLAHGAGGGPSHHTLEAIDQALPRVPTLRMEFDYRREGRRAPDRAPKLLDALHRELEGLIAASGVPRRNVVLGGRSMGGRMCSLAVADGTPAAGLVLLSYPLHPPGRSENLRVEHLPRLRVPCLFVSGDRDPFGSPAELEAATASIPGPVNHLWLEREGHDPKPRADEQIVAAVLDWWQTLP